MLLLDLAAHVKCSSPRVFFGRWQGWCQLLLLLACLIDALLSLAVGLASRSRLLS